jgi:hypothetical protein
VRLNEFSEDDEPNEKLPASKKSIPSKEELEDATLALHRAYLVVDTLLRNMPDNK